MLDECLKTLLVSHFRDAIRLRGQSFKLHNHAQRSLESAERKDRFMGHRNQFYHDVFLTISKAQMKASSLMRKVCEERRAAWLTNGTQVKDLVYYVRMQHEQEMVRQQLCKLLEVSVYKSLNEFDQLDFESQIQKDVDQSVRVLRLINSDSASARALG